MAKIKISLQKSIWRLVGISMKSRKDEPKVLGVDLLISNCMIESYIEQAPYFIFWSSFVPRSGDRKSGVYYSVHVAGKSPRDQGQNHLI